MGLLPFPFFVSIRLQPRWTPSRNAYLEPGASWAVGACIPLEGRSPRRLLERLAPMKRPFLLESARTAEGAEARSFLGGDPVLTLRVYQGGAVLERENGTARLSPDSPLRTLRTLLSEWHTPRPEGFPPFFGGACGVFSYDFARQLERLPTIAGDDLGLPEMDLGFYELVVTVDHRADEMWVTWVPQPEMRREYSREMLYSLGRGRIGAALGCLDEPLPESFHDAPAGQVGEITPGVTRQHFFRMVESAREYIARGDIFQANLSQRFSAPVDNVDPWRLYSELARINPSPFACYLDMDAYQVVSSSPERLVAVQGDRVSGRPIAGTRPRGTDADGDRGNRQDLFASPKERAEHVMLVDLMRNDLGRVCDYGSVRVDQFMTAEYYSHVMHIVSNVEGTLGPGQDLVKVLRAVFPGGTITGAPKVRCMEIIEELEPVRRGMYTGSAGYLSAGGDMDLNILIRTILMQDGMAHFQTGAGIVADSDPQAEYDETLYKAQAMRSALQAMDTRKQAMTAGGGR
ncbi:MAG: anthranilate synthase component I family protein [Nitrospirota bacterium]|nr:anthranilate synthase component I family protein [Nitrospirota bacterium]